MDVDAVSGQKFNQETGVVHNRWLVRTDERL
jgi:hypothetical protein